MRLMVCPRLGVSLYRKAPVTHFVSLIDPDERETPLHPPKSTTHQLQLIFNDLDDIAKGCKGCQSLRIDMTRNHLNSCCQNVNRHSLVPFQRAIRRRRASP